MTDGHFHRSIMNKIKEILSRPQVWGFFAGVAVMAIVALLFFYPDNFEGNSLQQPDMVQGAANGQEGKAWQEATGEKALWTNSLFGGMPTFQISPSYPSNSLFNWVNTVYGLWLPSPSNLLFMMMMGFFILMYALRKRWYYALIGALAWGLSSYFIIIIGAGHIWKFMALTYIPPTIAGFVLLYRGRYVVGAALTAFFAMMQLSANHPQMSYYFGLVMAIIAICYLVDCIRRGKLRRWFKASAIALVCGALALGANSPNLYNTYEYAKYTKRAQSELAETTAADTSEPSERPTGGMPRNEILGWSYGPSEMFSLVVPNVKGGSSAKPLQGQMAMTSLAHLDAAASIDPNSPQGYMLNFFPQYFNDSEGTNGPVYVGAAIVALFLLGCFIVRGPLKWAMIASTAMSCLLALGYNAEWLSDAMIYHFPLYNKFRAVESILVVAEFAMPLLGVLALAQFLEAGAEAWKQYRRPLCISFGFTGALALLALIAPGAYGSAITERDQMYQEQAHRQILYQLYMAGADRQQANELLYEYSLANPAVHDAVESLRLGMVRADGLRSFVFIALAFGLLLLAGRGRLPRWVAVAGMALVVTIDLYGVDKRYVDHSSFGAPLNDDYGITPDAIDLAILADSTSHYRVLDIPDFGDPRRSYFHSMLGGYHAAKLNRYEDIIRNALAPVYDPGFNPASPRNSADAAAMRVASMLNAKYIITSDPERPLILNPGAQGNAWFVDRVESVDGARAEMDATLAADLRTTAVADRSFAAMLPEAPSLAPGDTIYMTYYSPNTLRYHATVASEAVGVFSEVYFPWGWKASIDGTPTPLARVNYILRAMAIPAGSHEITMTFDPDSLHTTGAAAYACVSLIYLLVLLGAFVQCRRWRVF